MKSSVGQSSVAVRRRGQSGFAVLYSNWRSLTDRGGGPRLMTDQLMTDDSISPEPKSPEMG